MKSSDEESWERHINQRQITKRNHPVSLDCNCLITVTTSYHEKEVHPTKTQQKQPIDLKVHLPSLTLETSKQEQLKEETKILSSQVVGDVWSSILVRRMIHISQNQGRVWNAITNWSCSSPGERCCLTLRFSVWTSAAHLICVRLTRRIRVQSVHLSPPALPTTALLVIKPPDQAAHTEKWTMTVLMRRVVATTSIPTRQIRGMNTCYDTLEDSKTLMIAGLHTSPGPSCPLCCDILLISDMIKWQCFKSKFNTSFISFTLSCEPVLLRVCSVALSVKGR